MAPKVSPLCRRCPGEALIEKRYLGTLIAWKYFQVKERTIFHQQKLVTNKTVN